LLVLILICILFSFVTSAVVLSPLLLSEKSVIDFNGFSGIDELNEMVQKRFQLLEKLIESENPREQFEVLIELEVVCQFFKKAGLPPLPLESEERSQFMVLSLLILFIGSIGFFPITFAKDLKNDFMVPPPIVFDQNNYLSQINQFIINPGLGEVIATYRAIFFIDKPNEFSLIMPLPERFTNLQVEGAEKGTFFKNSAGNYTLKSVWEPAVHTVVAHFTLPAQGGTSTWVFNHMVIGFVAFMFPYKKDHLSNVLSKFFPKYQSFNVPPAKIVSFPEGFKWQVVNGNQHSHENKKNEALDMYHGIRIEKKPFEIQPFEMVGILPSRKYILFIALLQSAWLLGACLTAIYFQKSRRVTKT